MSLVSFESKQDNKIGVVTIRRPQALNALNTQVLSDLKQALEEAEKSKVRCLIITGEGEKAFVAGADIGEMKDLTREKAKEFSLTGNRVYHQVESLSAPVIAAVNGYALGGGCELALACDIRIASEKAVFALPETGLGITPGWGGMQKLIRAVGPGRAKEMVFTTHRLKAQDALRAGLVNAVYPAEELMAKCEELALSIAGNAPVAVQAAKRVMNEATGFGLWEAESLEAGYFASCFETADQRQAMGAFVEKRKPEPFVGK
ncbi:MAG TPA: enoyl-CoA hydratase [Ruminococcaceae bacterium]|jgi:enoyl-CoA hydratase|nr:enoyl-CoA hydratase [Oscillospiraceae bacterium]